MKKKEVKLSTTSVKFTPSVFITTYEVNTNFSVTTEDELLRLAEVKAVLNSHRPIIKHDVNGWSIGIMTPLTEIKASQRAR